MSFALPMLIGGALFLAVHVFVGTLGVVVLGLALFGWELVHDLGLYRRERGRGVR